MNKSQLIKKVVLFLYNNTIVPIVRVANTRKSQSIPKFELDEIHIKNAKLVSTRLELLKLLPKEGIVAELGVDQGEFSNFILNTTAPRKLYLIDSWGNKRYNKTKRINVERRFNKEIGSGTVEIIETLSSEAASHFKDNYFDWIYIDTSHSYETTIQELELYQKKVKPNGIIAGHDFILGNWDGLVRYGVIEAVHEFCVKHYWELIYLTTELNNKPSFAIRRIAHPDNDAKFTNG